MRSSLRSIWKHTQGKQLLNVWWSHQRATVVLKSNKPFVNISLLAVIAGGLRGLSAWIHNFLDKRVQRSEAESRRWRTESVNGSVIIGANELSSDRGLAILSRSKGNRRLIQFRRHSHTNMYTHIHIWTHTHTHTHGHTDSPLASFFSTNHFTVSSISSRESSTLVMYIDLLSACRLFGRQYRCISFYSQL